MEQKEFKPYDGSPWSIDEGSKMQQEWNDRTQSSQDGYNSIDELASKVKNAEANQVDGILRYDTKELLDAVTGVSTSRYEVTDDPNTSLNGQYKWNGSAFVKTDLQTISPNDVTDTVTEGSEKVVTGDAVVKREYTLNHFPFASPSLINTTILKQSSSAIKELYIPNYDSSFDYLIGAVRNYQFLSSYYRYEIRVNKVEKGTVNLIEYFIFSLKDMNPFEYDTSGGEQLLELTNNIDPNIKGHVLIDWNKITEGTGFGAVSLDYLASDRISNLDANTRIANFVTNYTKEETDLEIDVKIGVVDDKVSTNAEAINVNTYIQDASVASNGDVNPYFQYRSLIGVPALEGEMFAGYNMENGGRNAAFKDVNGDTINPVYNSVNGVILTAPANSVTLDYCLVGGDDTPGDNLDFTFYKGTSIEDFQKSYIGDFKIVDLYAHDRIDDLESEDTINKTEIQNNTNRFSNYYDKQESDARYSSQTPIQVDGNTFEDASFYDFYPTATATENTARLNAALVGGNKTLTISKPGTYLLNDTVYIDDNTDLIIGDGVILQKDEVYLAVFVNRGALTHTTNYNITIRGLTISVNGNETTIDKTNPLYGNLGHVSFNCVENLRLYNTRILDIGITQWGVQVCSFFNLIIDDYEMRGNKDGIHLGRGDKFLISNGVNETYDDAVALNGHDYPGANPEVGDIKNGIIENIVDVYKPTTTGYFSRLLIGAWVDWYDGMQIQHGDTVVNNGKTYRAVGDNGSTQYASQTEPTITIFNNVQADSSGGFSWRLYQNDAVYSANMLNIEFRNIVALDERTMVNVELDTGSTWNRSVYPDVPFSDYPYTNKIKIKDCDCTGSSRVISTKSTFDIVVDGVYNHKTRINLTEVNPASKGGYALIKNCDFSDIIGAAVVSYPNTFARVVNCQGEDINVSCSGRMESDSNLLSFSNIVPSKGDRLKVGNVLYVRGDSSWVALN